MDSASVKAAEEVGKASRGFDAGKKINGRKRHIVVDTLGLLLVVMVTAASVQDRDGARPLLQRLAASCRRIRLVWADGGYAGKLLSWACDKLHVGENPTGDLAGFWRSACGWRRDGAVPERPEVPAGGLHVATPAACLELGVQGGDVGAALVSTAGAGTA